MSVQGVLMLGAALMLLTGCLQTLDAGRAAGSSMTDSVSNSVSTFDPKQIAKSDVDRVADLHRREIFTSIRVLAEKLYRRNPREWRKGGHASIEVALDRLLDPRTGWRLPEIGDKYVDKKGTDLVLLALREDYPGDRVAAFIAGVGGMLNLAFEEKTEFFMFDELNPQKLHNSARNLEIAAWKLAGSRDSAGQLLLLTNEMALPPQASNLSFEREFGKMIGNLDLLSQLMADKGHRTIARMAQSVGSAIFLPVAGLR